MNYDSLYMPHGFNHYGPVLVKTTYKYCDENFATEAAYRNHIEERHDQLASPMEIDMMCKEFIEKIQFTVADEHLKLTNAEWKDLMLSMYNQFIQSTTTEPPLAS